MVKLASALSRLNAAKVMVIGDLLLDTYTIGRARRISPEAPVAIVHVQEENSRPGGAGNVALNLISLGLEVVAVGRIGQDWAGDQLKQTLQQQGVNVEALITQIPYRTPVKNRVIAENQQIIRIDYEQALPLPEQLEQQVIEMLPSLLQGIKVIAISDYGKGFLSPTLLQALIAQAKECKIPIIADPKGQDFTRYRGATVIKPNLNEAYQAANLPQQAALENVAKAILQMTEAELLMITRSESGISLFDAMGSRLDFPVHAKQVKDVTGAGDTVLAMLTCALANQLTYTEAAHLCNIAAGIAIERVGCAQVSLMDLAHALLERDGRNKVFNEEQLFALQEVLKYQSFILLALTNIDGITPALFNAIQQLSQSQQRLLIYVVEADVNDTLIAMLASLKEVDFILIHQESMRLLGEKVCPSASYLFEDMKLKPIAQISQLWNLLIN